VLINILEREQKCSLNCKDEAICDIETPNFDIWKSDLVQWRVTILGHQFEMTLSLSPF